LANTTKQFFSTADYDTAKYISDMLGQTTEGFITHSSNSSSSVSGSGSAKSQSYSSGSSSSENRMARNLLNPDEVMRLPSDDVLVFTRGEDAYKLKRVNYLTDEDFSGLFKDNPMH
jgi:type IV secretion system protein VirD4